MLPGNFIFFFFFFFSDFTFRNNLPLKFEMNSTFRGNAKKVTTLTFDPAGTVGKVVKGKGTSKKKIKKKTTHPV